MKILLLTMYFAPDIAANAVIMTELAEELAARGHQITVVTSVPHYADNTLDQRFRRKLVQQSEHNGVRVLRTYVYASSQKHRFVVRLLNYLSFNVLSTLAGLISGRHDVILAPSPPLTIGLSAWIIGCIRRTPYVYNVQDIYPDVAIKLGALKNPLIIALSRRLERFVYRGARRVAVLSIGFRANLLSKGVPEQKLAVIPNFVDVDFVRPLPRDNDFSRRLDLRKRFVVLYAGNIGYSQNLEHLLEAAATLRNLPDLVTLIVGNGSRKPYFQSLAREMCLENVTFLPFQAREDVPSLYATADVCVVTLRRGIAGDSVPSKVYTIMASGRPIVAAVDRGSDAWNLVNEARCGLSVEPERPADLAAAIRQLYDNSALRHQMGQSGREFVVKRFTPRAVAAQYEDLLNSLAGPLRRSSTHERET